MRELTKLTEEQMAALLQEYPLLPVDYVSYMRDVGWGMAESGKMVYGGPILPTSIYREHSIPKSVILFGDDFQGYCFGFDLHRQQYGEVDPRGEWSYGESDESLAWHVANADA